MFDEAFDLKIRSSMFHVMKSLMKTFIAPFNEEFDKKILNFAGK